MMDDQDEKNKEIIKKAMQEAIESWLDKKFAEFGKWSFYGFLALAFAALTYFIMSMNGYHKG